MPVTGFVYKHLMVLFQPMTAHSLHIELPDAETPSVWPWIVALVTGACLVIIVSQKIESIPASLQSQAQQIIDAQQPNTLRVVAEGRDLSLQGNVVVGQSVAPLLERLRQIDGVRIVRDELTVIDPVAKAAERNQQFLRSLSEINVASVAFEPGSVSFTRDSNAALNQLAELMSAHPNMRIRIEGHTDNTGPEAVNLRLSRERALAVSRFLTARGISSDRLIAKGYGSSQPRADNNTEEGRSRNRRIEISYVN